mgnify:CR=1 FL=1|jgi:hypothetical protein
MRILIPSLAAACIVACVPKALAPETPFTDDGDLADACAVACDNLERLECPEAEASRSGETCKDICVRASQLRELPLRCWSEARDVIDVRACGALRCIK